jgi:hypothetical protein
MSSFRNTVRRWHSTVGGLMVSCAPISPGWRAHSFPAGRSGQHHHQPWGAGHGLALRASHRRAGPLSRSRLFSMEPWHQESLLALNERTRRRVPRGGSPRASQSAEAVSQIREKRLHGQRWDEGTELDRFRRRRPTESRTRCGATSVVPQPIDGPTSGLFVRQPQRNAKASARWGRGLADRPCESLWGAAGDARIRPTAGAVTPVRGSVCGTSTSNK